MPLENHALRPPPLFSCLDALWCIRAEPLTIRIRSDPKAQQRAKHTWNQHHAWAREYDPAAYATPDAELGQWPDPSTEPLDPGLLEAALAIEEYVSDADSCTSSFHSFPTPFAFEQQPATRDVGNDDEDHRTLSTKHPTRSCLVTDVQV